MVFKQRYPNDGIDGYHFSFSIEMSYFPNRMWLLLFCGYCWTKIQIIDESVKDVGDYNTFWHASEPHCGYQDLKPIDDHSLPSVEVLKLFLVVPKYFSIILSRPWMFPGFALPSPYISGPFLNVRGCFPIFPGPGCFPGHIIKYMFSQVLDSYMQKIIYT